MKNPKPIPASDPVQFATSDVDDAVWPILTSHAQKFELNYRADDNTDVGTRPGRQFLASRANGTRYHVGIDLFANHRDKVVACEDGRALSYYGFYNTSAGEMSYALLVQHEDFVVNYGEVKGDAQHEFGWRIGDSVRKGQEIARVSTTNMIHFESYLTGTTQNQRWIVGGARPTRLLNPSLYLANLAAFAQGISGPAVDAGPAVVTGPLKHPLVAGNSELQLAAANARPPFVRDRDGGEPVGIIQDALDRVLPPADRINAGGNRGTFGPRTQNAVAKFQEFRGMDMDGKVGRETLLALDAALIALDAHVPEEGGGGSLDQILQIAANSEISSYGWHDNDPAPSGYIKGMALAFARVYCKFKAGDPAAVEMAKAPTANNNRDAIWWYREEFAAAGMSNTVSGVEILRHLFVLMLGLGIRESSGRHCAGRDTDANNVSGDTAEAGLFQTSYNARTAHPLLSDILAHYQANPNSGFLEVFREGVTCNQANWRNHGDEPGRGFQKLSKECPAFTVEFTALALRKTRRHWGPITNRTPEVVPAADRLFKEAQDAVDASSLCPSLV